MEEIRRRSRLRAPPCTGEYVNKKEIEKLKNLELARGEYVGPGICEGRGHGRPDDWTGLFESDVWPEINKYFSSTSVVLDVGSGEGRFTKHISKHVQLVHAIDPNVDIDPKFMYDNVIFTKVSIEEFVQEYNFDVVFLFGVFYMFSYPNNVDIFSKLYEVLTPGGHLIIIDHWNNNKTRYDLEKYAKAHGGEIVKSFRKRCDETWPHDITVIKKK